MNRVRKPHSERARYGWFATRLAVLASITLVITIGVPVPGAATIGGQPHLGLTRLLSWLKVPEAWASPWNPQTPKQRSGTAAGLKHTALASATHADGGKGHAPGSGRGELGPYKLHPRPTQTYTTGPAVGDGSHSFNPATSKRLPDSATSNSTLYRNADGTYTRIVSGAPLNYKGTDGAWHSIDTTLTNGSDGRIHVTASQVGTDFAKRADAPSIVALRLDSNHAIRYGLQGASGVSAVVSGTRVTYPQVLPFTDLVFDSLQTGVEESLVLASPQAANSWLFPLNLSGLDAKLVDGSVQFFNSSGSVVGVIPPANMQDSKFNSVSGGFTRSRAVTYELATLNGKPALRMTADASWLHDPARVYPVTVDPSYTAVTTGSTAVYSDFSCDCSGDTDIDIGTWNNGQEIGISFLQLNNLGPVSGQQVTSASVSLFDYWASTCTPERFDVAAVTQSWSLTGSKSYPGPSHGPSIGNVTANPGAACTNTGADFNVGVWMTASLSTATFNQWTTTGPNYGLAVYGSSTGNLTWKRFESARTAKPPYLILNYTPNQLPQVDHMYPPTNYSAPTLRPELIALGHDPDNWPGSMKYTFTVYDSSGATVATSPQSTANSWVVPAGKLTWSNTYYWSVVAFDGVAYSSATNASYFTTVVPQPLITSNLSQNTGQHGFDPSAGNYTTSVSDAQVQAVGPSLSVQRDYNSLDPRNTQAFGAGWSSLYDMRSTEVYDETGAVTGVVITYPSGEEVEFGRNADGTFTPPQGRYATLTALSPGYKLVDKSATTYTFTGGTGTTGVFAISNITDFQGRAESFTYTGGLVSTVISVVSGRSLHFIWSTPPGATSPHVATVYTDPATPGDSSTGLTWTYSYSGDRLTQVCPPGTTTACSQYAYADGSHFRTTVVDAGPRAYWRLADLRGLTTADDEMLINEDTLNGTYTTTSMTGQSAGPLNNDETAATFNGSNAAVRLPDNLTAGATYLSVGLWFKTTSTATGTLFSTGNAAPGTTANSGAMPVLYVGSDGKLHGHFWNNTVPGIASSASVNDGNWHYVVLTGAGNTQTLYLDGAQVGSPLSGQINNVDPIEIVGAGVYNSNGWPAAPSGTVWNYFNGQIGEVALYTRPLSASVIAQQWTAAHQPANLLKVITRPSGKTDATVTYDTRGDNVIKLTDINGGVWTLEKPTISGSSQVYAGAVLGSAPEDYWRLGETGVSDAVNQVKGGTASYNNVTLNVTGAFGSGDDTAASFNGTSSYVSLPSGLFPSGGSSQELWFKTTGTNEILLSSQQATGACPCLPIMWITSDGKLRALSPSTSTSGPFFGTGIGKCVDLSGGNTANGTSIQIWDCQKGNHNQNWTLYPDGTLRNFGKCMDIYAAGSDGGTANGDKVQLYDCHGGANQIWVPYNDGLRNPHSGRCLDDPNASVTNGTQFQIYDCNGTNAQLWVQGMATTTAVNDGNWHHAVLTTDGVSQYLYLDGGQAWYTTGSFTLTPGDLPYASLGGGYNGATTAGLPANSTRYFSGSLDEVAMYRSALSAADVSRHWAAYKSAYGIAPVETAQVGDPGSSTISVGALDDTVYNASQAKRWNSTSAYLTFQGDGNLVVYRTDSGSAVPTWASNTSGNTSAILALQSDGNLVIYSDSTRSTVLWSSHTSGHLGNVAFLHPNGTVSINDSSGRQLWSAGVALTDIPHVSTYTFDPQNGSRPLSTVDATGASTLYGYDTSGFLHTVTDPDGDVTTTGHDIRGNTVSQTTCQNQAALACSTVYYTYYPDDTTANPAPDQRNDLVLTMRDGRSSNANDNRYLTTYTYNSAGNRTSVTTPPVPGYPNGRTSSTTYTDGSQGAVDSGYAPAGLLSSASTPGGATETVSYFHNGDPAEVDDPAGVKTTYTYDGLGRVLTKTVISDAYPAGLTTNYTYDGQNRPLTITDPAITDRVTGAIHTARTNNVYDVDGNTLSTTVTDLTGGDAPRIITNTFDSGDRIASATNAAGKTTTYTYDAYGNRASEADPAGNQTTFAYDANAHLLTTTLKSYTGDPVNPSSPRDLVENSRAYDPAGRLASITDSMGWTTSYTYYDNGLTATVTRSDPSTGGSFVQQSNTYDLAGNLTKRVANNGATTTTYSVDGAGRTSSATLDPAGLNRTTSYTYSPDDFVTSLRISDASGTAAATDTTYDALGRKTSQTVHNDTAGHPVGWWQLTDEAGAVAADSSASGGDGTLSAGVTWVPGGAKFNGSSSAIATAGPVVNTSSSFSVSAWVKLLSTSGSWQTFVSQDGNTNSGFYLQYDPGDNKWAFSMVSSDGASPTSYRALSTSSPATGIWTHLVGVYNLSNGAMTLYVNGAAEGSAANNSAWNASGALAIGRGKYSGSATDWTSATIGNVQVYDRAISASDVTSLYSNGGTNAKWASGPARYQPATGPISTPGGTVDTSAGASFSVSAWVKPTTLTGYAAVLSQSGSSAAAYQLAYNKDDKTWRFTRPDSDAASPAAWYTAEAATTPALTGAWTHLVGVFDGSANKLSIYVNGKLAGTSSEVPSTAQWASTGPMIIGAANYNGSLANTFDGEIANMQVFSRPLSTSDITTLYQASPSGVALHTALLTTRWTLDKRGLITSTTDPVGNITTYSNDEAGKRVMTVLPAVSVETGGGPAVTSRPTTIIGYDTFGEQVEASDANGNTTVIGYDAGGHVVSTTAPSYTPPGAATSITPVSTRTYDSLGQLSSVTDALNHTTGYTYDQLGDVATVTDPAGGVTHNTYDTDGDRMSATDPTGAQTQTTYDYLGRQLTTTQIVRQGSTVDTATNTYAAAGGYLSSSTSAAGVLTSYGYDAAGEVTSVTDAAANTTRTSYDALGRTVKTTRPDGTSHATTYDEAGNQIRIADLDTGGATLRTSSATYDGDGHQLTTTDPLGNTTTFAYDASGALVQETQPVDASTSIVTSFGYDAAANKTRFTDGRGNSFLTTYNSWNLPESTIEPATSAYPNAADRTFTTTYNQVGQPVSLTSPGGVVVTATYDSLGNVTSQTGTGAEASTTAHSYGYDAAGRMTAVNAGSSNDTFTYDDRGLLLSASGPSGSSSFAYNADGQMTSRTDASGTSTYTYDNVGRTRTIADASTGTTLTLGYDTDSQLTSINYGAGLANRSYTYNNLHQLTGDTLKNPSGAIEASIAYGYDLDGNETSKSTTGFAGSATNTYTYDRADRLTSWDNGTTTLAYAYDPSGNRTQAGSKTFTYDERNELTSDGTTTYSYTQRGTTASTVTGGVTTTSASDAFNRVVTDGSQTYTYDGLDRLLTRPGYTFSYSGQGNDIASDGTSQYSRGPKAGLVGVTEASGSVLVMTDQHTDAVANFTAGSATLTGSVTYDPFGTVTAGTGLLGNVGYQSGWTDPGTSKVNMAARWYNPGTGQFTSRDTASNPAAPNSAAANRFQYGNDNPLIGTDPTGHCDWWNVVCNAQQAVHTVTQAATSAWNTVTTTASAAWNAATDTARDFYNSASQFVSHAWNGAVHLVTTAVHQVVDAYHNVKTWVNNTVTNTVNFVKNTAKNTWNAAVYTVQHPAQAFQTAAQQAGNFLKAHAADIASFIASTAVFMGCEAALGVVTAGVGAVAGAVACGALAGAVGSAVTYGMTTPMSKWNLGDAAKAVGVGALTGAAGSLLGAAGGKLVATFGSKILGPVMDSVASRLGPAALDDAAATVAEDVTETAAKDVTETAAGDVADAAADDAAAAEPHGGGGEAPEGEGASCPLHSFDPSTPVLMADGSIKPIGKVKLGDKVASTDPVTGKTTAEAVVALHDNHDTDLADVTIKTTNGKTTTLHTTWHHPFWDETDHKWTDAAELKPGIALHVLTRGKSFAAKVVSVRTWTGLHDMHDLTVAEIHTYYVVVGGAVAILVHNVGDGGCTNEHLADIPMHRDLDKFNVRASELVDNRVPTHGLNPEQMEGGDLVGHGGVANLSNDELIMPGGPQGNDPIRGIRDWGPGDCGCYPASKIIITGGHHRTAEIARRVAAGLMDGNTIIEFAVSPP